MDAGGLLLTGVMALGAAVLPVWPYSRSWDLRPFAGFALIGSIAVALVATGRL